MFDTLTLTENQALRVKLARAATWLDTMGLLEPGLLGYYWEIADEFDDLLVELTPPHNGYKL